MTVFLCTKNLLFARTRFTGRKAGGVLLAFIASVIAVSASDSIHLAQQLAEQNAWQEARKESLRILLAAPQFSPQALLIYAQSNLELTNKVDESIAMLNQLVQQTNATTSVRTQAAYILGQYCWKENSKEAAAHFFCFAFEYADTHEMFLKAGCALGMLFNSDRSLLKQFPQVNMPLMASRDLWSNELREKSVPPPPRKNSVLSLPGQAVVSFYRFFVSPALGQRCSMLPSCSEYFRLASMKHGILGIAIQADRFIREPSVVAAGKNTVLIDHKIRYKDPLEDHDFWMNTDEK